MGRITDIANGIRHSGVRLGPLDVVFAGLDYKQGKDEGEDDFRAAGGAGASTIGGWGGAVAGGTAGAAIGSVVPGLGTAIGGAVGAVVGSMGGGFGGGWLFDRADETVRGKSHAPSTFNQSTSSRSDSGSNALAPLAIAGGAGVAGYQLLKGKGIKNMWNPIKEFQIARQMGAKPLEAALDVAGQSSKYFVDATGKVIAHPATKVGAGLGVGIVANNIAGNPLGGTIDYLSGGSTNLKANDKDDLGQQHEIKRTRSLLGLPSNNTLAASDGSQILDDYLFKTLGRDYIDPDSSYNKRLRELADEKDIKSEQSLMRLGKFGLQNSMAQKNLEGYWIGRNNSANNIASLANAAANYF